MNKRWKIMSLVPTFEMGLWNAWILILPVILVIGIVQNAMKKRNSNEMAQLNKKEKKISKILMVTYLAVIVYSIFLPLKLGTVWFSAGITIYLPSTVLGTIAVLNFLTTPKDKPVTGGMYRISRNPMYLASFLMYVGISMACASWIYLTWAISYVTISHILITPEERFCLKKYGDKYREYMNRIPRWIGIPKSRKK